MKKMFLGFSSNAPWAHVRGEETEKNTDGRS